MLYSWLNRAKHDAAVTWKINVLLRLDSSCRSIAKITSAEKSILFSAQKVGWCEAFGHRLVRVAWCCGLVSPVQRRVSNNKLGEVSSSQYIGAHRYQIQIVAKG